MPDVDASPAAPALVTGASRGIGREIAMVLARAGFPVAITARDPARLAEVEAELREHGPALAVAGDLSDRDAPERILREVRRTFGAPQIIVNNAGTAPSDRFESTGDEVLDLALDLHVRAPFRLLRAALPSMRDRGGGCMVQVASTAGLFGFPFTAAYTAAKHGMVGLTRALAAEFGAKGPKVYAVCPGFVDTAITRGAAAEIARRGRQTPEEAFAALAAMNRIGRMHTVAEVAAAVLHLVREQPEGCVYNLDRDPPGFV